tara:strand:+ start:2459 stop:3316 length:858 start_codon:yes stop_codon:yes gene_type:complete
MSIRSLFQIIIIIIIFIILGSIYFKYFSVSNIAVEENAEIKIENNKKNPQPSEDKKNNELKVEEKSIKKEKNSEKQIKENKINVEDNKNLIKENKEEIDGANKENSQINNDENKKINADKKEEEIVNKEEKKKEKKIENLVKEVEYTTSDKNGNLYKIIADTAKTNINNRNILDLNNVRGVVTSEERAPIYIVSDFAEYNSSNLNSNFYQNVIINYEDTEITCDNFDINMETNLAIAYNNVVVTDPNSKMIAGKITFNMKTKDVNILPDEIKNKVKVKTTANGNN